MGGNGLIKVYEFNGWRCDSCDELITAIEGSWVEWLAIAFSPPIGEPPRIGD
jgi:hypothetical protein